MMYKYGISYYKMEEGIRVPLTGVDVRLLRPGGAWQNGTKLIETETSGHYEVLIETEANCGFYEVWDNRGNPNGSFSGKTCTIGKLDARGLQNDCIYGNHILDGVVTGSKIANGAVAINHLDTSIRLPLSKLQYELHNQDNGIGDTTQSSPANCHDDKYINHKLDKEYEVIPHIILTNQCNCFLYIFDIKQDGTQITITIAVGNNFDAEFAKYQLLALPY
ncbi:MAG: hypothetical protein PHQ41_04945 [Candidatus Cloacimonetes bacterium]|nr:hypothetical protein [Candidatus Cloacimonadota bacterium]